VEENQIKLVESTEGTFERTGASYASYYCVQQVIIVYNYTTQLVLNKKQYIGLLKALLKFII